VLTEEVILIAEKQCGSRIFAFCRNGDKSGYRWYITIMFGKVMLCMNNLAAGMKVWISIRSSLAVSN